MDAEQLRCQLQREIAARKEHENQCAAKTRQLWQLREQHEQEMRRYQDQLSVVRASLLQHLAHKAQLQLKCKQNTNTSPQHRKTNGKVVIETAAADDVPAADGSPKRLKQLPDQLNRAAAASPAPQATADTGAARPGASNAKQDTENSRNSAATCELAADACYAEACTSTEEDADSAEAPPASRPAAAVLLATAAKLQQLVGELTQREPAAAADLSVLQWQVTAAYGSIMGNAGRAADHMLLQQGNCSGTISAESTNANSTEEAAAASCTGPTDTSGTSNFSTAMPVTPSGSIKPQPVDAHPLEPEQSSTAAGHAHPAQSAVDVAAAARLFSGAACTEGSPCMDWYYLEGGSVRGPHDAAQMIRWFCSSYLEDQLFVAGVMQQLKGSSQPPPTAAFQPLRSLLEKIQQGGSLWPCGAVPAGRASMSQMLVAIPASPPPRARMSYQQLPHVSPRSKPALLSEGLTEGADLAATAAAVGYEPLLPVSTFSCEPVETPTAAFGQQCGSSSSGSLWGSGGGHDSTHGGAMQQLQQQPGLSQEEEQQQQQQQQQNGVSANMGQLGLKQIAARLRDSVRLDASPLRAATASPAAQRTVSIEEQQLGSTALPAHTGRLTSSAAASSSIAPQKYTISNRSMQGSKGSGGNGSSSGGGWSIQAALDTVSIFSAVEGIASQVAEQLDSLDNFAAGVAQGTPRDGQGTSVAHDGTSALDFVSDFPQLFPAAVMSDVVQRNSAAGNGSTAAAAPTKQTQQAAGTIAGGNTSGSSGGGGSGGIFSLSLPGVWRVESLHQMLRSLSPEPSSAEP